jgi:hypothetical protein
MQRLLSFFPQLRDGRNSSLPFPRRELRAAPSSALFFLFRRLLFACAAPALFPSLFHFHGRAAGPAKPAAISAD